MTGMKIILIESCCVIYFPHSANHQLSDAYLLSSFVAIETSPVVNLLDIPGCRVFKLFVVVYHFKTAQTLSCFDDVYTLQSFLWLSFIILSAHIKITDGCVVGIASMLLFLFGKI